MLEQRRPHLLSYIERRWGPALRKKLEPQDVFQEAAVAALNAWPTADLGDRDPFGWLCQIAEQRIVDLSRRFGARKRSSDKEVPIHAKASGASREFIDMLAASLTSASHAVSRNERAAKLNAADRAVAAGEPRRPAVALRRGPADQGNRDQGRSIGRSGACPADANTAPVTGDPGTGHVSRSDSAANTCPEIAHPVWLWCLPNALPTAACHWLPNDSPPFPSLRSHDRSVRVGRACGGSCRRSKRDVVPVLTRAGCNSGACHGKARGRTGLHCPCWGSTREFDYNALAREGRGRRVFPRRPSSASSSARQPPTCRTAAASDCRLGGPALRDDPRLDRRGNAARSGQRTDARAHLRRACESQLTFGSEQQLTVTAHYSDNSTVDVTGLTVFQSNEATIAAVSPDGKVKAGPLPGEAAVMARFLEKFAVSNVLIPVPVRVPDAEYDRLPRNNYIDGLVYDKLRRLGVVPSEPTHGRGVPSPSPPRRDRPLPTARKPGHSSPTTPRTRRRG